MIHNFTLHFPDTPPFQARKVVFNILAPMGNILCDSPEIRGVVKWIQHSVTSEGEIERLCSQERHSASMTDAVESSIRSSHKLPRDVIDAVLLQRAGMEWSSESFSSRISECKGFKPSSTLARINLKLCLDTMRWSYTTMASWTATAEKPFESQNDAHLGLLMDIWKGHFPDTKLPDGAESELWTELGFQNSRPESDLRGTGILSLEVLAYFIRHHEATAR